MTTASGSGGNQPDLAAMLRWGVLRIGRYGGIIGTLDKLFDRFANVGGDLLRLASGIIRDGALAVRELFAVGKMTPEILELTPQIPLGTFSTNLNDRIIVAADIVALSPAQIENGRRIYTLGLDETTIVADLLTSGEREVYNRIKKSDPDEAERYFNSRMEAYWMGKHW